MPHLMELKSGLFSSNLIEQAPIALLKPFSALTPSGSSSDDRAEFNSEIKRVTAALCQATADFLRENKSNAVSEYKKAIEHSNAAIRLAQQIELGKKAEAASASLYYCRGIVALILIKIGDGSADLNKAVADLAKSAKLNPVAETYLRLGEAHAYAGNLDAAVESLEKATDLDSYCAEAFLLKGLVHQARGDEDEYYDDIYEAIMLNPDLYREEFEPIMEDAREWEEKWDKTLKSPESIAMLQAWAEKAKKERKAEEAEPPISKDG